MKNITEQQKAEARAYNDKIKYNLIIVKNNPMILNKYY